MKDLAFIKKYYGEKMSYFCRSAFPTILETEGQLSSIFSSHFEPNFDLYNDLCEQHLINEFEDYIYSLAEPEDVELVSTSKTPFELMDEAGYSLYHCKTKEEIDFFQKYYARGEELCTFRENRLATHEVFFAVKKDVDSIKREDFFNPQREDLYGTSVISIQFSKGKTNYLSIKNRYNHTVSNCDATFRNNLENIIPGLTDSFQKMYQFRVSQSKSNFEIPNYREVDGKFYKYNYEMNGKLYCPNNIIIDGGKVLRFPKEQFLLMDYFLIDLRKEKKITLYDSSLKDSFADTMKGIKILKVCSSKSMKHINIELENSFVQIDLDSQNRMIHFEGNGISVGDQFLTYVNVLEEFVLENVKTIGNDCLKRAKHLSKIECESVERIGNNFCFNNVNVTSFHAPCIKFIGNNFFAFNKDMQEISIPNVEEIGDSFLSFNHSISKFIANRLRKVGNRFFFCDDQLRIIETNSLESLGALCFKKCKNKIYLETLKQQLSLLQAACTYQESLSLRQRM